MTDLLTLKDYEAPMGDLAFGQALSSCRALWTAPLDGEEGAPRSRIIHARGVQLHTPARLKRLGIRRALGYHKCGSRQDLDWVTAFRLLAWNGNEWSVIRREQSIALSTEPVTWYDLRDVPTTTVLIEVRRCGIDNWWTSWNLASEAFVLEGEPTATS